MILWIILFVLVIAISFLLAAQSMRDYQEIPSQTGFEYGLFLIRKPHLFNLQVISSLYEKLLESGLIISFERLIKGRKSALVVYGPKKILSAYQNNLDLLELEDYTEVSDGQYSIWEVGTKNLAQVDSEGVKNYFRQFPLLSEHEQFWWQLILSAKKNNGHEPKAFQVQIRAVVLSDDQSRRVHLTQVLQNLAPTKLVKLPKAFANSQILDFYKKRSLRKGERNPYLKESEVLHLLLLT